MSIANGREFLAIPGPTVIPDVVLAAMHQPAVDIYSGPLVALTDGLLRDLSRVFATSGKTDVFYSYILPHGLMELTAVFIACAAGLRIFWAMVSPGRRTRGRAVAQEGRSLITVALGLVLVLFVSGLVEGFVTPSPLPVWAKIGIGSAVLAAYWLYVLVWGRRAYLAGARGDLGTEDAGYSEIAA